MCCTASQGGDGPGGTGPFRARGPLRRGELGLTEKSGCALLSREPAARAAKRQGPLTPVLGRTFDSLNFRLFPRVPLKVPHSP